MSGAAAPVCDQTSRVAEERVARLHGLDLGNRPIRLLGITAGMAPQPHRAQMQERRPPMLAHVVDRPADRLPHVVQLAVGRDVLEMGLVAEGRGDPALRCPDADAGVVVLAHEEQWHRQPEPDGIAGGVDG